MSADLVAYLRARIAEDAADARQCAKDLDRWRRENVANPPCSCQGCITVAATMLDPDSATNPDRVLLDVAAKRKRLDLILAEDHAECADPWYTCPLLLDTDGESRCANDKEPAVCTCGLDARRLALLRIEAVPYSGRPDFLDEWRMS